MQFYMDEEKDLCILDTEEKVIEPEPEKKWSLYGEKVELRKILTKLVIIYVMIFQKLI